MRNDIKEAELFLILRLRRPCTHVIRVGNLRLPSIVNHRGLLCGLEVYHMKGRARGVGIAHAIVGVAALGGAVAATAHSLGLPLTRIVVGWFETRTIGLNAESRVALAQARITPEVLAASGATSTDIPQLVENVSDWWNEHGGTLVAATSAANSARANLDAVQRKVRAGTASGEDVESLVTCRQACVSTLAAQQALMDDLWAAATASLNSEVVERLEIVRANLDGQRSLDTKYLVVAWSTGDALNLRRALRSPDDAASQQIVAGANALAAVSQAQSWLTSNLAAIETAWAASY